MFTIQIDGRVTDDGQLQFDLPADLPPGDARITIEVGAQEVDLSQQFTDEEIADLLTFTPKSGAQIVAEGLVGGWEHKGIEDSVEFVEELRRKQAPSKW